MEEFKNKAIDFVKSNKKAVIAVGALATLAALKLYFRGGVCRADKNLEKKVVVITGGNSGIGKVTVETLAKKGCTVIFGARDEAKSEAVVKSIRAIDPDCQILYFPLDLADKRSIEEFSERVKEVCDCVNILINNAGVYATERRQTKDGFQMDMGVNHLGHFYLTYLLWGLIRKADKPRIINVSSNAHGFDGYFHGNGKLDFEDMNYVNNYKANVAYSRSKIANILFTRELQAKMDWVGMYAYTYSLHPGVIPTDLVRQFGPLYTIIKIIFFPIRLIFLKTAWEGAQTTLHLVMQDESKLVKGEYYSDCRRKVTTEFTSQMDNARKLWEISEKMLGIKFEV